MIEAGGTHDVINKLRAGTLDWGGCVVLNGAALAWQGIGREEYIKAGPYKELRTIFIYGQSPYAFTVLADAGIDKIEDLDGKTFHAGLVGSGTEEVTKGVLAALGVKPDYYVGSLGDAVQACKEGRCVGFSKTVVGIHLDASQLELLSVRPIKILSWTKEQQEKALKTVPGIFTWHWDANQIVPLAPHDPIDSIMHIGAFSTTSRLPQELGYEMWKGIMDNWDEVGEVYKPSAAVVALKDTLEATAGIAAMTDIPPFHAGFVQLLVERGYEVPGKMIPPEYVAK